jgi:hypothetical protein
MSGWRALLALLALAVWPARAATPEDQGEPPPPPPPLLSPELRIGQLERQVEELQSRADAADTRLLRLENLAVKVSGTLDVGFCAVQGDGSGVRPDYGGLASGLVPAPYQQLLRSWVLLGDPLSTAVNSRGEVADTGTSRAIRYNPLHTLGRPTFLVNAVSLGLRASYDDHWVVNVLLDFLPRDRDVTAPGVGLGDFLDLKLAYLRYQFARSGARWVFYLGKVDSVLGLEYRTQEAADRLTVTPSLICRYTCGRPVGLKAQVHILDEALELSLALTNGSSQVEFFPFSNEVDFNTDKTGSARVKVLLPIGLELSVSGALGAQDRQRDDVVLQWHLGAAAQLTAGDLRVAAEAVLGAASGKDGTSANGVPVRCGQAPCLAYAGAYLLASYRLWGLARPYVRVDWRRATMVNGLQWAYESHGLRATVGLRLDLTANLVVKAEYTFNRELPPLRDFPDDVFASSFLVTF